MVSGQVNFDVVFDMDSSTSFLYNDLTFLLMKLPF